MRLTSEGIAPRVRGAAVMLCAGVVMACGEPGEPPLPDSVRAASIKVSPTSATMHDGDTVRFHATVLDNKGVEIAGAQVQWLVENDTILEIDAAGLARARTRSRLGQSSTAVVAKYFKVERLAAVDYTMRAPLNVWPDTNAMFPGMTRTLVAREILAERAFGGPKANVVPVSWSSSDETVVTVDASGKITAVGLGHARITITGSTGVTASAEVYVVAAPATPLRFLSVSGHGMVVVRGFIGVTVEHVRNCGLTTDGSVYCWGVPAAGAEVTDRCETVERVSPGDHGFVRYRCVQIPYRVPTDIKFKSLVSRGAYSCGIATTNRVYCWGINDNGQLGIGTRDSLVHGVTPIASTDEFQSLHAPMPFAMATPTSFCALRVDGAMVCWGGVPLTPTAMNPNVRWRMMADAGECALAADSTAYCRSSTADSMTQRGTAHWVTVAAGRDRSCALSISGRVFCNGGFTSFTIPNFTREIAGDVTISSLGTYAGGAFGADVCGLTAAGEMYCVAFGATGTLSRRDTGGLRLKSFNGPCAIATDDRAYCDGKRFEFDLAGTRIGLIAVPGQ